MVETLTPNLRSDHALPIASLVQAMCLRLAIVRSSNSTGLSVARHKTKLYFSCVTFSLRESVSNSNEIRIRTCHLYLSLSLPRGTTAFSRSHSAVSLSCIGITYSAAPRPPLSLSLSLCRHLSSSKACIPPSLFHESALHAALLPSRRLETLRRTRSQHRQPLPSSSCY